MNTQNGRSMVEMLGVLAIVGVLSVGAIAGYGKAMMKYKLNKQAEQLNQVISAISRYKSSLLLNPNSPNASSLSDFQVMYVLIKLGEIPKEMYTTNEELIKDVFAVEYYAYHRNTERVITLRTKSLPRTESGFQACKNLYLIAKEWHKEIFYIATVNYKGAEYDNKAVYWGDGYPNSSCDDCKHLKDLTLSELDDIFRVETGNNDHYSIIIHI